VTLLYNGLKQVLVVEEESLQEELVELFLVEEPEEME
jgi:hypothetical protein